jgi:hypothetical protein
MSRQTEMENIITQYKPRKTVANALLRLVDLGFEYGLYASGWGSQEFGVHKIYRGHGNHISVTISVDAHGVGVDVHINANDSLVGKINTNIDNAISFIEKHALHTAKGYRTYVANL